MDNITEPDRYGSDVFTMHNVCVLFAEMVVGCAVCFSGAYYSVKGFELPTPQRFEDSENASVLQKNLGEVRSLADAGDPRACYSAAKLEVSAMNFKKAVSYLKSGAEGGNVSCMAQLGHIYFKGLYGLKRDTIEGLKWISRAAALGNSQAEFDLAVAYSRGEGVEKDSAKSFGFFKLAAEHNNEHAFRYLWKAYLDGNGTKPDLVAALKWIEKDAAYGNVEAARLAADMYDQGRGCLKDSLIAFKYLKRAVELKDEESYIRLSRWYRLPEYTGFSDSKRANQILELALASKNPRIVSEAKAELEKYK